jgi:hypothetical protein
MRAGKASTGVIVSSSRVVGLAVGWGRPSSVGRIAVAFSPRPFGPMQSWTAMTGFSPARRADGQGDRDELQENDNADHEPGSRVCNHWTFDLGTASSGDGPERPDRRPAPEGSTRAGGTRRARGPRSGKACCDRADDATERRHARRGHAASTERVIDSNPGGAHARRSDHARP